MLVYGIRAVLDLFEGSYGSDADPFKPVNAKPIRHQ